MNATPGWVSRLPLSALLTMLLVVLLFAFLLGGCTENRDLGSRPIERRQPQPQAQAMAPVDGGQLAAQSTLQQLDLLEPPQRDLRELALRLDPQLDAIPLTLPGAPRAYALDDHERFWVRNTSTNQLVEITATLAYSTPVAYVWVENDQDYDRAAIKASIDRFTDITYPNVVTTFGSEWHPGVDNDPRLHVLYNTQMGGGVMGYFSGADEYTRQANPFSNQKEMFYMNLAGLARMRDYSFHDMTLAHEFQHMIHWHMDRGEDLWINEGLSEYAPQVAEFPADSLFVSGFAADPDLQLTTWGAAVGSNRAHYASAYLFISYLAQRFGREAITKLVAEQGNGMHGVDVTLQSIGAPIDAEQLFADWVVANYVDQPDALGEAGRYGYIDLNLPRFEPAVQHTQFPVEMQRSAVFNYAADYIELGGEGDVTFVFQGDPETRLAGTDLQGQGRAWWGNRADDSMAGLTRQYDLSAIAPGTPLTLTAGMWWEIEADYDYGYVMASRDGEHWSILPGQHTAFDTRSGNALGHGYTGTSGSNPDGVPQWVDESFDLSDYAGGPLWLEFSYVTDDAVNLPGWLVDDVQLASPMGPVAPSGETEGWQSTGWLLTDNRLPQKWLLQVMEFEGDTLEAVRRVPVDGDGRAQVAIENLGGGRRAVLAVSGLAPITTLGAQYEYAVETSD